MDSELQFHVDARADDLVAAGLSRATAVRQAQREFGDPLRWKEQGREALGLRIVDQLRADVRYGLRWLRRSPAFAAAAVLSIALGIGTNTAVFSLVNAVLLKLMPVDHPESLVLLARSDDLSGSGSSFPYPFYEQVQSSSTLPEAIGWTGMAANVEVNGAAERLSGSLVSGNFFQLLGIRSHRGRLFTPDDNRIPGGHPLVVLGYRYWQRRFGGDDAVIGQSIHVNSQPLTIVGVAPSGFDGLQLGDASDIYVPIVMQPEILNSPSRLNDPGEFWVSIVGRVLEGSSRTGHLLREGQPLPRPSMAGVEQELDALFQRYSATYFPNASRTRHLTVLDGSRGRLSLQNRFERPLVVLSSLAAAVLFLVCLNVANLVLARTVARRRELSVRIALGAGRARVVSQLLVETLLIAAGGGAIGLLFARWAAQALTAVAVPASGTPLGVAVDLRVVLFATALSAVVGFVCGVWPAWAAERSNLTAALSSEGRTIAAGRLLGRKLLVTGQIALSFALLIGAGLFARTLLNLRSVDFGFDTTRLLSARLDPRLGGYDRTQLQLLYDELCDRIAALPGVRSASYAAIPLVSGSNWGSGITLDSGVRDDDPGPDRNAVGPGYFSTVGLPLVAGRDFTKADGVSAQKVAIVNEAFAHNYLGDRALGRRIGPGGPEGSADFTIVGVARNAKYAEIRENASPFWYVPYRQLEPLGQSDIAVRIRSGILSVHVRTAGNPATIAGALGQTVAEINKRVVVFDVRTMDQQIADRLVFERLLAGLAGGFALIAIVLAALGLYGVVAYDTASRTREIGVRMALGATRATIGVMVVRQTAKVIGIGVIAGVVVSVGGMRYVRSLLYRLQPTDPLVLVAAAIIVVSVTAFAAWLPARRATKIDPFTALQ